MSMILLLHILAALSSLAAAGYTAFRPSPRGIIVAYCSIGITLLSGIILVIADRSALLHACLSGTLFSTVSVALTAFSRRKLMATQSVDIR